MKTTCLYRALNVLLQEDIEPNGRYRAFCAGKLGNSAACLAMTGKAALEMFKTGRIHRCCWISKAPDMTGDILRTDEALSARGFTAAGGLNR